MTEIDKSEDSDGTGTEPGTINGTGTEQGKTTKLEVVMSLPGAHDKIEHGNT